MKQTKQPNVKLKAIEYLLLAIQSDPGKTQRHYLRRLCLYHTGKHDYHKGGRNNGFFTSKSYRGVLWYDDAPQDVSYKCWCPVDDAFRSKAAQMHLTTAGWARANQVRQKIGLDPISQPVRYATRQGRVVCYE